jgi:hypothetical protein
VVLAGVARVAESVPRALPTLDFAGSAIGGDTAGVDALVAEAQRLRAAVRPAG